MSLRGAGGVVQPECLALQKHTVVVYQHGTIDKFEGALTVILEVADSVESVGVVALRFDLEAQLNGLPLDNLVAVWHYIDCEGIGLLDIEVIRAGGHCEDDCEECNPEAEEPAGCKADTAEFVENCFHVFQSLSFDDFFG